MVAHIAQHLCTSQQRQQNSVSTTCMQLRQARKSQVRIKCGLEETQGKAAVQGHPGKRYTNCRCLRCQVQNQVVELDVSAHFVSKRQITDPSYFFP